MDKFKLHYQATELSSHKSAYKLARELLELQEQYTIYEQKIAGYTSILEDLLKVNKVLMDEVESLKSQQNNNVDKTKIISIVTKLISECERNVCMHEDTYRGGSIWTICSDCGMKWADDNGRGGFVPYQTPKAIEDAESLIDYLNKQQ